MKKIKIIRHDGTELPQMPLLLTEKQTAQFLGVSLSYLRKARSEGAPGKRTPAPSFVRVDGRVYYRAADLAAWVNDLATQRVI